MREKFVVSGDVVRFPEGVCYPDGITIPIPYSVDELQLSPEQLALLESFNYKIKIMKDAAEVAKYFLSLSCG